MMRRRLHDKILKTLKEFPVVAIIGARQVGKTTLAKALAGEFPPEKTQYLDLELDSDLYKLTEAQLYLEQYRDALVILDEVQQKPELFKLLRALVDRDRRNGRFLILGSASPELLKQSSESLAGRIVYHELSPFDIMELDLKEPADLDRLWLRGGFPDSFLASRDSRSFTWRDNFVKTFLERDIPAFGIRIPSITLRRFWTMLAHSHGQVWNASKIAASMGMSAKAIRHYLDILHDTLVVRQLQPHFLNTKKRMVKSPKVYLRDSGILHYLLKIHDMEDLYGHAAIGASWEGWCIEQVCANLPGTAEVTFYRTGAGAEIDLLIRTSASKPAVAVEFKRSLKCTMTKSFRNAFQDVQPAKGFFVYPGDERYAVAENVQAVPATQLHDILAELG